MGVPRIASKAVLLVSTACSAPDSSGLFERARDAANAGGAGAAPAPGASPPAALPELQIPKAPVPEDPDLGGADLAGTPALLPSLSGRGSLAPSEAAADAGTRGAIAPAAPPREVQSRDAGAPLAPPEPELPCAGAALDDACWYLGEVGQSCAVVCAPHDGFSSAALAAVGTTTQGGSNAACAAAFDALGVTLPVTSGVREDGAGLGCHLFIGSDGDIGAWWLTAPDFTVGAANAQSRLACGCAR